MIKEGVMERLVWYQELRLIFQMYSDRNYISKSNLLQGLTDALPKLSLQPFVEYDKTNPNKAFSFDQICTHVQSLKKAIKWDDLFESLHTIPCASTESQLTKPANLVAILNSSASISNDPKSESPHKTEKGTIKNDFPILKFSQLDEVQMGSNLKFLSLGGNLITSAAYEFPSSLIVLNLSHNKISNFRPSKPLSNLKFLNLSYNFLDNLPDISSIITLKELFISDNQLSQANFLFSIKNLSLLDLAFNMIEKIADLKLLCECNNLRYLNLRGNALSKKLNYKEAVKAELPEVSILDPKDIGFYSNFKQIGFSEAPLISQDTAFEQTASFSNSLKSELDSNHGLICRQNSSFSNDSQPGSALIKLERQVSPPAHRAATPKSTKASSVSHKHSKSYIANEKSGNVNGSAGATNKRHKSIIVSKNNAKPKAYEFGNPIAAMMIKPAANIFKPARSKNISIDISKLRIAKINN